MFWGQACGRESHETTEPLFLRPTNECLPAYAPCPHCLQANAIWLSGHDLCRASSLPLEGMVIISNGAGCPKLAVDLYDELDRIGVRAFVYITRVICPKVNMFARSHWKPRQGASMAMMSLPAANSVGGSDAAPSPSPSITALEFLERHVPMWSGELGTPFVGTNVHITVEDPYVC